MKYFPVSKIDLRKGYKVLEEERKQMVFGTEAKIEEGAVHRKKLEPRVDEIMTTNKPSDIVKICLGLLDDQNPENRILGIMAISSSNLILIELPSILNKFYTEPDEEVRTQILISIGPYTNLLNTSTTYDKRLIRENDREIKKVLKMASKDESDLVKITSLYAMGLTLHPIFVKCLRDEMWTNRNHLIRSASAIALNEILRKNEDLSLPGATSAYSEFKRLYYEDDEVRQTTISVLTRIALDSNDLALSREIVNLFLESGQSCKNSAELSNAISESISLLKNNIIDKRDTES